MTHEPTSADALAARLNARTVTRLPKDWQKGLNCPECGSDATRPKCFYDMGPTCPRHNPDNYEPTPYVTVPVAMCAEAATAILALSTDPLHTSALAAGYASVPDWVAAMVGEIAALRHWSVGHIDALLLYAAGSYPNDSHVKDAVAFCRIVAPGRKLRMDPLEASPFHPARAALTKGQPDAK